MKKITITLAIALFSVLFSTPSFGSNPSSSVSKSSTYFRMMEFSFYGNTSIIIEYMEDGRIFSSSLDVIFEGEEEQVWLGHYRLIQKDGHIRVLRGKTLVVEEFILKPSSTEDKLIKIGKREFVALN